MIFSLKWLINMGGLNMSKLPTPLEQMFEIALKTKNVKAAKFTFEWMEFEEEAKKNPALLQPYSGEGQCNILA